jgi:hypothetical protein
MNRNIVERDLEKSGQLEVLNIEIVTDSHTPGKVELYMLDEDQQRIEGGQFDAYSFSEHILEFYNANY